MKYFVPTLQQVSDFNSQTGFQEKLGGLPFGLPIKMYPICQECGNPMSFIAQFIHHKERLDLGKEKRILYIFVCNYEDVDYSVCQSWDADLGANACIIIESETLTKSETEIDSDVSLEKEFIITDWQEYNDEITNQEREFFLNKNIISSEFMDGAYQDLTKLDELTERTNDCTKLGSVPYWIQFPETPRGNYKFVGQLDSNNGFEFGDLGIGYIFVEKVENEEQLPKGKFLWQCG
jgi:hypothetical protein